MKNLKLLKPNDEESKRGKTHLLVQKAMLAVAVLGLIVGLITNVYKRKAELKTTCVKKLQAFRDLKDLKLKQFITINNYGERIGRLRALRVQLISKVKSSFSIEFVLDSIKQNGNNVPFTEVNIPPDQPFNTECDFTTEIDTIAINSMPTGLYEYKLQAMDEENKNVTLKECEVVIDNEDIKNLKGINIIFYRHRKRAVKIFYPILELKLI